MAFLSTNRNEYDRIGTGCHLYGGLRFSSAAPDEPSLNPLKKYIPEHNLARFWETPHLDPHEVGFSQPVLRSTDLSDDEFNFMRPPGSHRCDQPPARLKRRNLLTGSAHVGRGDRYVPLWMVDEGTVRNRIFKLRIGFEFDNDAKPVVSMGRYSSSIAEECLASHDIVQLKALKGHPNMVAARTMRNLELCSPEMDQPQVLHNQYVDDFIQIPYMKEEMALIDRLGHMWHGKIGESLSRVKHFENIMNICATDCPRVLLGADSLNLRFMDVRENPVASSHGNSLMELKDNSLEARDITDIADYLKVPQTICHITPLPGLPNYTLLSTEKFHHVLDHRVPQQPLLTMEHSCFAGGDFVMFGATYIDRSRAPELGRPPVVMPYYTMNLAVKPALQLWSMYFHPNINACSSVGPPKNIQSFDAPISYLAAHKTGRSFNNSMMGTRTFSMHHCAVEDEDAFLFRISDRGVLWYDTLTIKDRKEHRAADAEVVLDFYDNDVPPTYEKSIDAEFLRPPSTAVTLMDVHFDVEDSEDDREFNPRQVEADTGIPFDMKLCTKDSTIWKVEESDVIDEAPDDRILSNIVLKMWSKMGNIVRRGDKQIVLRDGKLVRSGKDGDDYDPYRTMIADEEEQPKKSRRKQQSQQEQPNEEEQQSEVTVTSSQPLPVVTDSVISALANNISLSKAVAEAPNEDEYDFDVDVGY